MAHPVNFFVDRLPERLRWMRGKSGLSQKALAERIGISRTFLTLIETGRRMPSVETLREIMAVLSVRVTRIAGWKIVERGWWGKIGNGDDMLPAGQSAKHR